MNYLNLVRQVCRACRCVFNVPIGQDLGGADYRCEGCDNADYERHHFDKSLPAPESIATAPQEAPVKDDTSDDEVSIDDTESVPQAVEEGVKEPGPVEGVHDEPQVSAAPSSPDSEVAGA